MPFKTYVVRLHNLTSMNIFLIIDHKRSEVFFVNCQEKAKIQFQWLLRSSHQRCSVRKSVRNFVNFTGKHLCQSFFFNKVPGLRTATLLKKRLWHRCFSVNFAKLQNTSGRLLLKIFFTIKFSQVTMKIS